MTCCKPLDLVLSRDKSGLVRETMFSLSGGHEREVVVVHFKRAKVRTEPNADATYAVLEYCPFCKAHINVKPRRRK
jgi:hypothetical protein